MIRKEEHPSVATSCKEVSDIMTKMDEKLVRTFWKIAGFIKEDGTQLEKNYVETTIALVREKGHQQELHDSNRFLANGDQREKSDDSVIQDISSILEGLELEAEVLPIVQTPKKMKQKHIADYFKHV